MTSEGLCEDCTAALDSAPGSTPTPAPAGSSAPAPAATQAAPEAPAPVSTPAAAPAPVSTLTPPPVPAPGPVLRAPVVLSYVVITMLAVVALTDLARTAAAAHIRGLMEDVGAHTEDELYSGELFMAGSLTAYVIALLTTGVFFVIWFHRTRVNAGALRPDLQRRGSGWAIGGWIIPIGNLWLPRSVAGDIWDASLPDYGQGGKGSSHALLNSWWALWLVSALAGRIAGSSYDGADTPDAISTAAAVVMVGNLIDIVAALLAIAVVHRLTVMQHRKISGAVPSVALPQSGQQV
ncbi:DUF4328 domain-containing protein [Streptomyces sp. SCSIO 30461]|uniref:DUF4328 domain-containing protein n=1 Tax=Streptomyces sp. SCSIO 30461 TaxID=3118085 RepID=UPI0030D2EBC8